MPFGGGDSICRIPTVQHKAQQRRCLQRGLTRRASPMAEKVRPSNWSPGAACLRTVRYQLYKQKSGARYTTYTYSYASIVQAERTRKIRTIISKCYTSDYYYHDIVCTKILHMSHYLHTIIYI